MAGPHEEHSLFCAYVQEKWNPALLTSPPPLRESWHVAPGVPFTMEAFEHGLRALPAMKAVAFPYAPAQVIQCQSQSIARLLYPILQRWWNQFPPFIPQEWKDGWVVWLPKPNKQPSQVANLRPLALAEPIGKVVVSLIAKVAAGAISDRMRRLPQFAYMAHRGTTDALRRAALHCEKVNDLIQTQPSSVKNKRDQQPPHFYATEASRSALIYHVPLIRPTVTKSSRLSGGLGREMISARCFNSGTMAPGTSSTLGEVRLPA